MVRQLITTFRDLGPITGLFYFLDRLAVRMRLPLNVRCYRLVEQPVAEKPRLSERRRVDWSHRFLAGNDPVFKNLPVEPHILEWRLSQNAQCLALFQKGELAGYMWLISDQYFEDEVRCRFDFRARDDVRWDFDVYIFPDYRLGFAFSALWDAADAEMRKAGVRSYISRISAFNLQSHRSHKSLGAHMLANATYLTVGKCQLMLASCRPWLHLSLSDKQRPSLNIHKVLDGKSNISSTV